MAGDWIKVEITLHDKPEVIAISKALQISRDLVVGKLIRLWSWANQQTETGYVKGVGVDFIDDFLEQKGFEKQLRSQGWLRVKHGYICFPNFDHHNTKTAKRRALQQKRVSDDRAHAKRTKRRLEKRREEKSINTPFTPFLEGGGNGWDDGIVGQIVHAHPRPGRPLSAHASVRVALERIGAGCKPKPPDVALWPPQDPVGWLLERTQAFAKSQEGVAENFITSANRWFDEGGYLQHPGSWSEGKTATSKPLTREQMKERGLA